MTRRSNIIQITFQRQASTAFTCVSAMCEGSHWSALKGRAKRIRKNRTMPRRHEDTKPHQGNGNFALLSVLMASTQFFRRLLEAYRFRRV